ncbi:MAG: hypothetical protein D6735_04790 [Acidobacteria bacterium]|nr:MAG: hypothetical protein D6735_04790 [Acidobacteriota bacterium]
MNTKFTNVNSGVKKTFLVFITIYTFFISTNAQDIISEPEMKIKHEQITLYAGFSPDSNTFLSIARTKDARFGYVALQYSKRFFSNEKIEANYTMDIVPYASLEYPLPQSSKRIRRRANSFGLAPIGIQIRFPLYKGKLVTFFGVSGGFLYFNKKIPNNSGTKFNFTASLNSGIEIPISQNKSLVLGYNYYHISNGNRGIINPGFDNNVFTVGYKINLK